MNNPDTQAAAGIEPPGEVWARLNDPEFRRRVRRHEPEALAQAGYRPTPEAGPVPQVKVVTSTRDISYVLLPNLDDEGAIDVADLNQIHAGGSTGSASTVGSIGSASTLSSITPCASSAGTAGSLGSAGTAGSSP